MRQGSFLRKFSVVVACGLAAGCLTEAAAAHTVRFGGTLTVRFNGETNVFKGRATSTNPRCEPGRRVFVMRARSGPDLRVASDRTDSLGKWRVVFNARAGRYYSQMLRKDIAPGDHRHICSGVKTSVFVIPPRCGNDLVEAGEECDDGNVASGDGCDSQCQVEGLVAQLAAKERGEGGVKPVCSVRRFAAGAV
jgi:cysteine-rich repeat protein